MNRSTFAFAGLLSLAFAGGTVAQDVDSKASEKPLSKPIGRPVELTMRSGGSTTVDLRALPHRPRRQRERPERPEPPLHPVELPGAPRPSAFVPPTGQAPAPAPILDFDGLDREFWGAGSPPDPNGDAGPNHYIQSVNTSVGIYSKVDGSLITAFTFDTLMSQGSFGNQCDTENFGDPVVLYDTFEDRWVITDFAFTLDGGGNVNPPEAFQCFAVSKTADPVAGGWSFYSIRLTDVLNDYPKFGVWTDGIYMSSNTFGFAAGASFQGVRVWAFNKAQMYAGVPTVQVIEFNVGGGDFTLLPSNARLQTGTPPPGTPNYFISSWNFTNALTVYKFHADWKSISLSTFSGPDTPLAATSWPNAAVANAPQSGTATLLDVLQIRAMMQNQYTNFGGTESLWVPHTVRRANTTGFAAPRWYQVDVSGGTVAANIPQAATWDPDAANVTHRFMPSLALDRQGNLALGYSTSSSTSFPSIKYAGRLASDPVNTLGLTEQTLFAGTASQTGSTRWGDYSSMTLDPDGCTFWYTNEYANTDQAADKRWRTRVGRFKYDECTPVGAGGTLEGTVTATPGGAPIAGATAALGSRTTTTDGAGSYQFTGLPAGTYPSLTASAPGYVSATQATIVITDGGTATKHFSLAATPSSDCLSDTTQADFQAGVGTNVDLTTSPGDVALSNLTVVDQSNSAGTTTGTGFGTPSWTGQTFVSGLTGPVTKVDVQLFCNGCGATPPDLTLSIRATSAGLPTGADLVSTTILGSLFASGATVSATATFGSPPTLTLGTQYALILRPVSAPAGSGYFWIRSSPSTYANGSRVLSADSGATWSADATRDYNFKVYVDTGFAASGSLVSSLKDANPLPGLTPTWSTLSWTANVPSSTTLQFQVAASSSPIGPFDFVGPDGTAATFFTTTGASLAQFDGLRYLEYKAYLATTDNTVTPSLHDVQVCHSNDCTLGAPTASNGGPYCEGSTVQLATPAVAGATYAWTGPNGFTSALQNPTRPGSTVADAGLYSVTTTIGVCTSPAGSTTVVVNAFPATPTASNTGPYCEGATITLSTPTVAGGTYAWTGPNGFTSSLQNPTVSNATLADAGLYSVTVTVGGCPSAAGTTNVVVNAVPATPTASNTGPYCEGATIGLLSPSVAGATYAWTGPNGFTSSVQNPTRSNATLADAGTYSVTVTVNGCSSAAGTTDVVVDAVPATPTASNGGPYTEGDTIALTTPLVAGATYDWTGPNGFTSSLQNPTRPNATLADAGTYSVTITVDGCPSAAGTTDVVVQSAIPPGSYYTVTGCRLLDTRQGGQGPRLSSGVPRTVVVVGSCGVPAEATAVSVKMTVVAPTDLGHLTAYPADAAVPPTSTLNFNAGATRGNNAIIGLAGDASGAVAFVAVISGGTGTVDLVVDVMGYFVETTSPRDREGASPPESDER